MNTLSMTDLFNDFCVMTDASVHVGRTQLPLNGQGRIRSEVPLNTRDIENSIFKYGWQERSRGILLPVLDNAMSLEYGQCANIHEKRQFFVDQHNKFQNVDKNFHEEMTFLVIDGAHRRQALLNCIPKWESIDRQMPLMFHARILDPMTPVDVLLRCMFDQNVMVSTQIVITFVYQDLQSTFAESQENQYEIDQNPGSPQYNYDDCYSISCQGCDETGVGENCNECSAYRRC